MIFIGLPGVSSDEEFLVVKLNNKETSYFIGNKGNVISATRGYYRLLKPYKDTKGYSRVTIHLDGEYYDKKVHRLVASAFIPNIYNKPEVNHKDGNKSNNSVQNLEWATSKENSIHVEVNGLRHHVRGESQGNNKYSEKQIRHVCECIVDNKLYLDEISKLTGVHYDTIIDIKKYKSWNHITREYDFKGYNKCRIRKK